MILELLLGWVLLFGPVSDKPETYWATATAAPGTVLGFGSYVGWVDSSTCFNRCVTLPGQRPQFLAGGFTKEDMADLGLTIWRWNAETKKNDQVMSCARFFDGSAQCWFY